MDGPHAALIEALLLLKTASVASLGTVLAKSGYNKCSDGATDLYDSYGPGPSKNSISLSHAGRIAKLYIVAAGAELDVGSLPGPEDPVLVIQQGGAVLVLGQDLVPGAARALVEAAEEQIMTCGAVAVFLRPLLRILGPVSPKPPLALMERVFGPGSPVGQGARKLYWADQTLAFARAIEKDAKRWQEAGVVLCDRTMSIAVAAEFAAARQQGDTWVLCSGTGELAFALQAAGVGGLTACEWHPRLAQAAQMAYGTGQGISLINADPLAPVWAAMNGAGSPLPNIVAQFPFVPASAYALGLPECTSEPFSCPPLAFPAPPPSIADWRKGLGPNDCVGSAMLKIVLQTMGEGMVGTFIVPGGFGVSAAEKILRFIILLQAEVLGFASVGSRCILTIRKRPAPIVLKECPEHEHRRSPESTNPWVRWIGGIPVFVTDRTIHGAAAGEAPTGPGAKPPAGSRVLGDLLKHVAKYSSLQAVKRAKEAAAREPGPGAVRLYGTDLFVPRLGQDVQIIELPDFILHRTHTNGQLTFKTGVPGPAALTFNEFGLTAGENCEHIASVLRDPATANWLYNVTNSNFLSVDLICAIPIPEE